MTYLLKPQRREAIILATLRQVSAVGFSGLTTRGVAKELGVAPGTIHHNFASLTDLKCAALEYMADADCKAADELMKSRPPADALLEILVPSGEDNGITSSRNWISAADEALRSDRVAEVYGSTLDRYHQQLSDYIKVYFQTDSSSADLLSWKFLALSSSLSDFQNSGKASLSQEQVIEIMRAELRQSLSSK